MKDKYIIEARDGEGKLRFGCEQPPIEHKTENHYELRDWLASKGWASRKVTW